MPPAEQRKLTIEQAAKVIYQVAEPSPQQVGAVADLIARGLLEGTRKGHWATTADSVARYMATATLNRKSAGHNRRMEGNARATGIESRTLRPVYRELLKDYFLAVIRRRDTKRRTKAFQHAVLVGQMAAVALIVAVFAFVWWTAGGTPPPSELAAVEAWLEENTDRYKIHDWFPPQQSSGGSSTIRVKYEYSANNPRRVQTDREFVVQDGKVVGLTNSP